ncbi:MAG: hypothetical protein UX27_C0027G0007 [Candidatus Azambacteria bacterium GW2011_GWA2_45_90]|uniref:Uncharacterized protein n=1 Tax=Candidatus Azambacteria bacterium GW2011_GWA2_45_90 TaxID=1618614 RepID=A0A0G1NBH6_9BACT|nr:MAG: hypothetical protein UX27_C0027G0007 [Candidatus Azambacteria bacterium GW2011_GWA2_45_90]
MNKKIIGVIIIIFGLVMVGGSMGSVEQYGVAAPISMSLIVIFGLALIFWDKIKTWLG